MKRPFMMIWQKLIDEADRTVLAAQDDGIQLAGLSRAVDQARQATLPDQAFYQDAYSQLATMVEQVSDSGVLWDYPELTELFALNNQLLQTESKMASETHQEDEYKVSSGRHLAMALIDTCESVSAWQNEELFRYLEAMEFRWNEQIRQWVAEHQTHE